jgi:hypothetical protein
MPSMPSIFRLVDRSGELLADAGSIERKRQLVAGFEPGRYVFDEIRGEIGLDACSSGRWGRC